MRKILFAVLLLVFVACTPVTTTMPTLAVLVTPAPLLSQTYTGQPVTGGTISLNYPEGWVQGGTADAIILSNSATALDNPSADLQAGQVGVSVSVIPRELAGLSVVAGATPSPTTILENFLQSQTQALNGITFGAITPVTIGTKVAAQVQGSNANDDALLLIVENDTAFVFLVVASDKGQMANFTALVYAIGDSLTFVK